MGLAVWCTDQAGPYQTVPYRRPVVAARGRAGAAAARVPPRRHGQGADAVPPGDGQVRLKGVTSGTNAMLHPWRRRGLTAALEGLPAPPAAAADPVARLAWERWPPISTAGKLINLFGCSPGIS